MIENHSTDHCRSGAALRAPSAKGAEEGDTVPTFIRLAKLTEQGIRNIQNLKAMLDDTRQVMEQNGVKLVQGWATLGEYDVVAVIEAPDAKTAAKVSALIASRGYFRAATLSAIPMNELSDAFES